MIADEWCGIIAFMYCTSAMGVWVRKAASITPKTIYCSFSIFALMATITVLKLINTAPIAGLNIKAGYKTPAANGMAITL
jgi:hypothetical protein